MKLRIFLLCAAVFCQPLCFAKLAEDWGNTLDTARDADYLSEIEKNIIFELNKARSDPKRYAETYIK
ncbi:MAG: hypothetical protein LBT84_00205, partial [Spirochaetia bacterium]|nr:hypothetical protein [Spirochaetia bacterium]